MWGWVKVHAKGSKRRQFHRLLGIVCMVVWHIGKLLTGSWMGADPGSRRVGLHRAVHNNRKDS